MDKHVIIIGSGLGGLECGSILSRKGFGVTVLEKHTVPGGALQTFRRGGSTFDTGFHYVGGLGEGESLGRIFRWLGLMELPWKKMDPDCFDEVCLVGDDGTSSYPFVNGHERFAQRLEEFFPGEKEGLKKYVNTLKEVGDNIFDAFEGKMNRFFEVSASDWLESMVKDPVLRDVLSGTSLKMELRRSSLPLYIFAQINDSFIRSAWRLEGGGAQIADSLTRDIRSGGGTVLCGKEVASIIPEGSRAVAVTTTCGERFEADYVLAAIHPAAAISLVGDTKAVRNIYRKRLSGLQNTAGFFTANIALAPGCPPSPGHNLYLHRKGADLWSPDLSRTESVLVHFYPESGRLDLLSPMDRGSLQRWEDLPPGRRGAEYEALKEAKAEECLDLAAARLPWLREAVDRMWTSSPLSWQNYTGTPGGSAYGIRKDFDNLPGTILPVRTPLENMFLTGQSLNLHGLLGVTMTAIQTCAALLGDRGLHREIIG